MVRVGQERPLAQLVKRNRLGARMGTNSGFDILRADINQAQTGGFETIYMVML